MNKLTLISVVRTEGLEPSRGYPLRILSPVCLPFHHVRPSHFEAKLAHGMGSGGEGARAPSSASPTCLAVPCVTHTNHAPQLQATRNAKKRLRGVRCTRLRARQRVA